jgi:hypothetical protein
MVFVLLLVLLFLIVWLLAKMIGKNRLLHYQLLVADYKLQKYAFLLQQNHDLVDFHNALGQSIAALHIQLQVSQKLWQVNPMQAQKSLSEADQLSSTIMCNIRQIVKDFDSNSTLCPHKSGKMQ